MKVSIIVPVFNEEKTIGEILKRIKKAPLPARFTKEIIVIDDASSDFTPKILKKQKEITLVTHPKNKGKGAAIKSGVAKAKGDIILVQDADLEYSPSDYKKLLIPFYNSDCQAVFGTRLIHYPLVFFGPNKTPMPIHLLANRVLSRLTNLLYGGSVSDMETCFKLIRAKLFRQLDIQADRFDFEPEITAKLLKKHIKIYEIPISVRPRSYKEGKKISWKDGLHAVYTLFKYRLLQ